MPSLERLAASLAVTAAVVVPTAGLLLHDNVCVDESGSTLQRFVSRLERAGVFTVLTDGVTTRPGACRGPGPPVHLDAEGVERAVQPAVEPSPQVAPPSAQPPDSPRMHPPGRMRVIWPRPTEPAGPRPHGVAHTRTSR